MKENSTENYEVFDKNFIDAIRDLGRRKASNSYWDHLFLATDTKIVSRLAKMLDFSDEQIKNHIHEGENLSTISNNS